MTEHVDEDRCRAKRERRERAHLRVRKRVSGTAERPRLAVYRSLKLHLRAGDRRRPAARRSPQAELGRAGRPASSSAARARSKAAAKAVGELIAERAKEKGIDKVVFDRGGYVYHGNVKALAEAAREKGLEF